MKDNKPEPVLKTISRILLVASIVLFAVSLTSPGGEFLWSFLKPLSALLFVNFFIMNLLAKAYAKYDDECTSQLAMAAQHVPPPSLHSPSRWQSPAHRDKVRHEFSVGMMHWGTNE